MKENIHLNIGEHKIQGHITCVERRQLYNSTKRLYCFTLVFESWGTKKEEFLTRDRTRDFLEVYFPDRKSIKLCMPGETGEKIYKQCFQSEEGKQ